MAVHNVQQPPGPPTFLPVLLGDSRMGVMTTVANAVQAGSRGIRVIEEGARVDATPAGQRVVKCGARAFGLAICVGYHLDFLVEFQFSGESESSVPPGLVSLDAYSREKVTKQTIAC